MAVLPGISVGLELESQQFTSQLQRADRQMDRFAGGVARSSRAMRGQFQQIGFQLQDTIIQLQSGTRAAVVFAQQGSQIAGAFGPAGAAIGVVIAAAGLLAPLIFDLGRGTRDADQAAKDFARTQDRLKDLLDDSTESIRNQAAEISKLSGAHRALGLEGLNLQLVEVNRQITAETDNLREALAGLQTALLAPRANEIAPGVLEALDAIRDAQRSGDASELAASISALIRQIDDPALLEFAEKLVESGSAIQDLRQDADELQESIVGVSKGVVLSTKEVEAQSHAVTKAATATEDLTAQQRRLAEAGKVLLRTSALEERFDAQAEAAQELAAQQEALAADQARAAAETARLAAQPFETSARNVDPDYQDEAARRLAAILIGNGR